MTRTILAVIVGYAAWTILWLGGNAALFGASQAQLTTVELVGAIALSVVCSLAAGVSTAAVARTRASTAVLVMAALLFLTGVGVQISAWAQMPIWYHATFLALILPVCVLGSRLARTKSPAA